MKILPKSLGAVVRRGDYFVLSNTRHGNTVQYSPDAEPGAEIVGSFGAANGNILYWSADETHFRIAATAGGDIAMYEHLCAQAAEWEVGFVKPRAEPGKISPMAALTSFLNESEGAVPDFHGTVPDLLRMIGVEEISQYGRNKFLNDLCRQFPDLVKVSTEVRQGRGGGRVIMCLWSQLPANELVRFKL